MIKKLLLGFLFFISVYTFAQQDKKWSIEANYSLVPSNGFFGKDNLIDLGLKYRFIENNLLNAGISLNSAYFIGNDNFTIPVNDNNFFIFQPRVFSEFNLPFSEKLKPTLGLGYSFFSGTSEPINGFNVNIGLIYEISDKWFIQSHYDWIDLKSNPSEGYNNIRIGTGFRF